MHVKNTNLAQVLATLMLMMAVVIPASAAQADGGVKKRTVEHVTNAKWKSECGACHVAYPPRFLPAESWQAIMAGLDKHFGSNASLDAESAREILAFLEKNARTKKPEVLDKPLLRISDARWFKSEHKKVKEEVWKNPKVKSPANCGACHTKADSDNFSESNIKIPQ